jgi:iron-sulfur cluster repair protein YtfE (RIC family)
MAGRRQCPNQYGSLFPITKPKGQMTALRADLPHKIFQSHQIGMCCGGSAKISPT